MSKLEPESDSHEEKDIRGENRAIATNMARQRKRISQQLVPQNLGDAAPIKMLKLAPRFKKTGRSTTFTHLHVD